MKEKDNKENLSKKEADKKSKSDFPGYPHYPASEDIYNQEKEVKDVDMENFNRSKKLNEIKGTKN